jgi:hypothetical protein
LTAEVQNGIIFMQYKAPATKPKNILPAHHKAVGV